MEITINNHSCKGCNNKVNEDYCLYKQFSHDAALAVLVDGMGGLSFGDVSSHLVGESIASFVEKHLKDMLPNTLLLQAIISANEMIHSECYRRKCRMGAAVAVLLILDQRAYYTGLGNVRLYANTTNGFIQLTDDHIYSPMPDRFFLTRCINGKLMEETAEIRYMDTKSVFRFLLCTDGCYMNASDKQLESFGAKRLTSEYVEDDNSCIEIIFQE